jgi:hypothetical protein
VVAFITGAADQAAVGVELALHAVARRVVLDHDRVMPLTVAANRAADGSRRCR